jgi:hypothetical protein
LFVLILCSGHKAEAVREGKGWRKRQRVKGTEWGRKERERDVVQYLKGTVWCGGVRMKVRVKSREKEEPLAQEGVSPRIERSDLFQ